MILTVRTPLAAEDLEKIEAEMKKIVKEDLPIKQFTNAKSGSNRIFQRKR